MKPGRSSNIEFENFDWWRIPKCGMRSERQSAVNTGAFISCNSPHMICQYSTMTLRFSFPNYKSINIPLFYNPHASESLHMNVTKQNKKI